MLFRSTPSTVLSMYCVSDTAWERELIAHLADEGVFSHCSLLLMSLSAVDELGLLALIPNV